MFLDFNLFKPSTWLSGTAEGIMGAILGGIRTFCFWLVTIIYQLMVNLYNLFEKLCNARILDNEIIREMAKRIGLLLGIVMFFYIVFSFIQMLIDPEKITNKDSGAISIVKKAILVIVMLGVSNSFFQILYQVQYKIIESDAISKLILPYTVAEGDKDKFGNLLSRTLIEAFYQLEEDSRTTDPDIDSKREVCNIYKDTFLKEVYDDNKYDTGYMCLNESVKIERVANGEERTDEVYIIYFNGIISIAVGLFVVYTLTIYCFKIGVRMIQLAFLEIISPMAIISYMSPKKDNMFTKWWKIYFSTYIDVFVRIAIINFVIFLICTIFPSDNSINGFVFWESFGELGGIEKGFITVVIILALLTFAKKAPDLLKELLPASASKLGFGMSMKDIVGLEKTAKIGGGILGGALGGAAIGLLSMRPGGIVGGLLKGGLSGLKGQGFGKTATSAWKSNKESIKKMRDIEAHGGGWLGSRVANLQGALGIRTAYEEDEQRIADLQAEADLYNTASKEAESEAIKNGANYIIQSFDGNDRNLTTLEKLANDQTIDSVDRAKYQAEYAKLLKSATMFNLDYGLAVENSEVFFKADGDFEKLKDGAGKIYQNYGEVADIKDKNTVIGSSNTTIEVNISKLAGAAQGGRGKRGKEIRNNNNNEITKIKLSDRYKKHKADSGK